METLVFQMLGDELKDHPHKYLDVCQCPLCLARIQAVALNNLKPKYVTGTTGKIFGEYESRESQHLSDIMAAIGMGIAQISANPPHP